MMRLRVQVRIVPEYDTPPATATEERRRDDEARRYLQLAHDLSQRIARDLKQHLRHQ